MTANTDLATHIRTPPRVDRRALIFALVLAAAVTPLVVLMAELPALAAPLGLPWWALAAGFAAAELTAVRLRFRNKSHFFSVSEIPLLVGLVFAAPAVVLLAQMIGIIVAFGIQRRQSMLRLVINLLQFAAQTSVAALVFHGITDQADPLGPRLWLGAPLVGVVALVVGELVINGLAKLSGAAVTGSDLLGLFSLSTAGVAINAALGLVVVYLLWEEPRAVWLGLVGPVTMVLAYRAYSGQRLQRKRAEAQYQATRALHAAPRLDQAIEEVARHACEIVHGARAEVALLSQPDSVIGDRFP